MRVLDPTAKVFLTAFAWDRMQGLVDSILDEATLLNSDSILDSGHRLSTMLDDIMYGGITSYDNPDQLELDFSDGDPNG